MPGQAPQAFLQLLLRVLAMVDLAAQLLVGAHELGRAAVDQLLQVVVQRPHLALGHPLGRERGRELHDLLRVKGLLQEKQPVGKAQVLREVPELGADEAGHEHDVRGRVDPEDLLGRPDPGRPGRQVHVEEDGRKRAPARRRSGARPRPPRAACPQQCTPNVGGASASDAIDTRRRPRLEDVPVDLPEARVVVHRQNAETVAHEMSQSLLQGS